VLTGGASSLTNIRNTAQRVMKMPVRLAKPEGVSGMADKLDSPSFATAIGLLRYADRMGSSPAPGPSGGSPRRPRGEGPQIGKAIGDFLGRLLPD
jgi:cell division protein FtsA